MIARFARVAPQPAIAPRHLAIVMDGMRDWARSRGLPDVHGYRAGGETLASLALAAADAGIEIVTVAAPAEAALAFATTLAERASRRLAGANVRVRTLGVAARESAPIRHALDAVVSATSGNDGLTLNLSLSYGARTDVCDAIRALATDVRDGKRSLETIDDDAIAAYLPTAGLPDPDLLIRTGGALRVRNALLFEIAYAELWATPVAWPDFDATHLDEALAAYAKRQRRFGT